MQRSTGEVQLACVLESFSALGGFAELRRVSNAFPCRVKITTTDRDSANYRTEEGLRAHLEGFEFVHLACDCHRCSSAIGNSLKSVQSDVSGAVKVLRDIFPAIMFDELEIPKQGSPLRPRSTCRPGVVPRHAGAKTKPQDPSGCTARTLA